MGLITSEHFPVSIDTINLIIRSSPSSIGDMDLWDLFLKRVTGFAPLWRDGDISWGKNKTTLCTLAESVQYGAGEQISKVPKMPRANPANGLVRRKGLGLLSIPELPKTMLVYQEVDCKVTGGLWRKIF